MDIESIKNDRAKGKVEYMGETVNFTYRPAMITSENFTILVAGQDQAELGEFMAGLIATWDVTAGGQPLEVTAESISRLPLPLLRLIGRYIAREEPQKELGNS
jgi:hypothetical protein